MAHAHPDMAATVVADDPADSGDPPTQTGAPVKEGRVRIDGHCQEPVKREEIKKRESFLNSI